MLDKTYDPSAIEERLYRAWEDAGCFRAGAGAKDGATPFSIVIPPPNVTGSLHMGHALNNALQDVLVRFERMRGKDVLWQPGLDHAGIATQMVVERQLMERQEPERRAMGRDAFIERVWEWKAESGGQIVGQLKRLGASCDWSRERFTMDDGLSRAVNRVFVELYRKGLIYKDKRLVNWDPKLLTAISDLEVQQVETKGHLWHFRYPIKGEEGRFIVVATTRPETMLGDTGVAVHPDDERYTDLVGKTVILPLVGREIPIVADEYSDPEKGSGAVKITPAHDFNDFEVGRRHDLEPINILNPDATLNETVPESYRGLDRFDARKRVVADLEALNLVEKIEPHFHAVPHGDRSGVTIEPLLTDQWYVDAATLAQPAIEAVEQGRTDFAPKNWERTYFEWMRNIQPWCISRQLWWGHRIPAWYGPKEVAPGTFRLGLANEDLQVFCAEDEAALRKQLSRYYGDRDIEFAKDREQAKTRFDAEALGSSRVMPIWRDPDVLDTWFSSALWPFSTLGWPDETPELARYYPTSVLVTGFDIIFFWVARMMMMGLHFCDDKVPFRDVYIHALVRDEKGQKMSKSKGNVIDPLELIDAYGADALRFTLAAMAAPGRDIKLATSRVEGYRNFGTKLWNASRFAEMNGAVRVAGFDPASAQETLNRWIAGESDRAVLQITEALEAYRFNDAAAAIYQFVWRIFCDWYIELSKPILNAGGPPADETRVMTAWVLDRIVALLHPFMPFMTEELWQARGGEGFLMLSAWPEPLGLTHAESDAEIGWVIRFVSDVRSVRAEMNVPAGAKLSLIVSGANEGTKARVARHEDTLKRLARLDAIGFGDAPKGALQIVLDEATLALPLAGVIDIAGEQSRLGREIEKLNAEITQLDQRLGNKQFVDRAPPHVVEEQRERRAEAEAGASRLRQALNRLAVVS